MQMRLSMEWLTKRIRPVERKAMTDEAWPENSLAEASGGDQVQLSHTSLAIRQS
jgi:hypothetical protein